MDMKHEMDPAQNEVINGSHNGLKLLPRSKTQVLDQVRRLLGHVQGQQQVSKPHSQVALYGEPDTGKTEIARNYADWLQTACPDVKIFWVSASDDVLYRNSYRSIAKQFGIPGYDNPTADISALVNSWLATEFREPWLLIVDDVNDTQMSFPDSNGSILITTRQKYIASWYVPGRQLIEVTEVSESEPYKILRPPLNVPYFDRDFLGAIVDQPTSSFPAASLANAGSSDMESDDSSVTDIEVFGEQPASTKLSLPGNNMYSLKHAVTRKPKDKAWCRHRQHRPAESVSLDGDETQSLVSDLVSDMDSFATGSQIFSENPASTKLSSQDEEVDMLKEANHAKPKAENFYSHLADNFDEKEEIKSLISGYEDIQSQDGSRSVRWEVRDAAVSYIAEMLANDPFLEPLYKNAAQRLEGKRFVRNHCRLLKSYYLSLRSQASNQKQGVAIEFLRPRAHRTLISIKIRENMEFQDMRRKEVHVELPQDEGRDLTLERYLSNVGASSKSHTDDTMQAIREADEGRKDNRTTEEQSEDAKSEDAKREDAKREDAKREDAKREDAKREDVKSEDIKSEESKDEYSQYEEAEEQSEDGWEGKEEGYDTGASLISLGETRSFFVSGQPLVDFRANFQDFLYPKSEAAEGTQPKKTQPKRSHVVSRGARLLARLFDVWSPPKDGCERVRYMCDCGDYTFLDVREISPGGLQRFRQRLASHGLSNIIAASAPSEFPDGLSPPPSAYLGTARSRSVTSQNSGLTSSRRSSLSTQPTSLSWSEDEAPPEDEQTIPQYLLLCVNQKSLPELIHINCRPFHNDQYLCQQILKEYQITRDKSTWRPSLLVHAKLLAVLSGVSSFLEKKTPHCLEWIFRFSRSVSEISFFQMDTGDFVRFQLVPVGELTVPNHFKCAEYPPESEVKAGNYEYEPVPMIDVAIASIPLWHLTRPVQHSDMYWIKTFPKKMRYPLRREPGVYGKPIIGWGIRVNEAFHWKHFLFLILAVSIGISIIVAIYVGVTSDASSAFGLGAFLAALVAIYIPHQYFAWKEKLN
ncbi:hypothetical protein CkaCkLH20_01812 [Colletotrichum karsti]|uniref:ORC1/DEAH AAA+ ATPase domain-containing protein n=1 Tax=Colletotrichum karsti TaxID=1095194 RepID=A0A9P6LPE7_9PEZI|nr:uncharacterized protein CkaCkLH20_01812 [Colletotrichum karsti]KAF9880770.1 hypothetical protein CkaCkLH20_01812 [Colletotrichum karsti]